MKACRHTFGALAVAIGLAVGAPAFADDDSSESLSALSAQWWQWALSIPAAVNPLVDATGAHCMVGQRGAVWFLAGSTTGAPAVRSCTVPEGTPFFFPVINTVWINTPACDGLVLSVAQLRALAAGYIDGATGLSVVLDNRPVTSLRRVRSDAFAAAFPEANLFGAPCVGPGQIESPSVDDGYYIKLRGLEAGLHSLRIRGTNTYGFSVDVSYTLNVVKTLLKDRN